MECVRTLCERGDIDVKAQNKDGITALMSATSKDIEIVRILCKKPNIDVNAQSKDGRYTALMRAAIDGNDKCLLELCKIPGIGVNVKNKRGETALTLAEKYGHKKCVEILRKFHNFE
jgi:ankyrin repeat protein